MHVRFSDRAVKEVRRLRPPALRDRVMAKIEQYAADPASLAAQVKALKGRDAYRLRVGDIRVLFAVEPGPLGPEMRVAAVLHRRDAYD